LRDVDLRPEPRPMWTPPWGRTIFYLDEVDDVIGRLYTGEHTSVSKRIEVAVICTNVVVGEPRLELTRHPTSDGVAVLD
jgi:hypothetical protein